MNKDTRMAITNIHELDKRAWGIDDNFKQPEWCKYNPKSNVLLNCWLLFFGEMRQKKDCTGCKEYEAKII